MGKWKVGWTINSDWGESSDFDSETFDNFDSAKAKFYEKMGEVCEIFFENSSEGCVRYHLDEEGEDGEAIVQYIKDFFCGNLTQEDSLVVDFSGDFNLCINKRGIDMEESASCCCLNIYPTIQTDFLTVDDEDKNYTLYFYDPYDDPDPGVNYGEAIVILDKI